MDIAAELFPQLMNSGCVHIFQFLYVSKPGREEIAAEVYEDEVDLRRSYLNSSFHSAWSERSVDPDDFRVIFSSQHDIVNRIRTGLRRIVTFKCKVVSKEEKCSSAPVPTISSVSSLIKFLLFFTHDRMS